MTQHEIHSNSGSLYWLKSGAGYHQCLNLLGYTFRHDLGREFIENRSVCIGASTWGGSMYIDRRRMSTSGLGNVYQPEKALCSVAQGHGPRKKDATMPGKKERGPITYSDKRLI